MNAETVFISAVIAASPLKEFASIQTTGKRKNRESIIITAAKIIPPILRLVFIFSPPYLL